MRRIFPFPLLSMVITITWVVLTHQVSTLSVVAGVLLGVIIPLPLRRLFNAGEGIHAPALIVKLTAIVTWDIIVSNITVARLVLGRMDQLRPAFVEIPLDAAHPYAANLLASIITMTPGTVSAVLDLERRRLLVHALDCADPAALTAQIKSRYERPLKEIFRC